MPSTDIKPQSPPETVNAAWHAVLCVEGVRTADRREFKAGSLKWRALPIPLMMQLQTADRHQGSVVVGRIDRIERIEAEIHGWGTFDMGSENGKEAHRLVSEQILRGISIDAELFEIDREMLVGEDDEIALVVEEARIGAATIVSFQAFPQAVIALSDSDIPPATEDGRTEATKIAVTDAPFNADPERFTALEWIDATAGSRESDAPVVDDHFLPHHEPDGTLSRPGLYKAAASFNLTTAPTSALARARSHLAAHFRRDLKEDPPQLLSEMALVAHAESKGPPAPWFVDPELKGPTPLTVARNGRIYGHAALWDACHTGYQTCMKPPRTRTNYSHFLVGSVFTSDCDCDTPTPTGPIVLSTTHADPYSEPNTARRHYDNTGQAVADVAVGEDAYGIWVAGALRPGVSESQIRALRGSSLSGDWRYIGGNMELISLLAVNTPGFPIPRVTAAVESGIQVSLTAAGIADDTPPHVFDTGTSDPADILEELKKERSKPADEPSSSDTNSDSDSDDSNAISETEGSDEGDDRPTQESDTVTESEVVTEESESNTETERPASSGLSASELLSQLTSQHPATG